MDFTKIPINAFKEILEVIQWVFPNSKPVIGGGALRDSVHGRPIKDVDVFLRSMDYPNGLDSPLTKRVPASEFVLKYSRKDMYGAWDFIQRISGYDVQLIVADFVTYKDLAGTFDLGLSRITYDGRLYVHSDFLQDSEDQAFRILRADTIHDARRSLKRIARLQQKYPEFRHIVTATEALALGTFKLAPEQEALRDAYVSYFSN